MHLRTFRACASSLVIIATTVLVGCQTTGSSKSVIAADSDQAIFCPKCEMVWVRERRLRSAGGRFKMYHTKQVMRCPDCDSKARQFSFNEEIRTSVCKSCGGTMAVCSAEDPTP